MIRTRLRDKLASSLGSLATRIELVGSTALTPDQVRIARRMREAGESMATICATLRVARSTLYRAFNNAAPAVAG
jgi:DNA invertase Pin-like site-specific DNA recombinase